MTLEEMQQIAQIISTADGGCSTCVHNLVDRLNAAFPQFHVEGTSETWKEKPSWADDDDDAESIYSVFIVTEVSTDVNT